MTFFPEPLRPSGGRQDDEYKVSPIESDRHEKEKFNFKEQERKKRINLYGAFLVFLTNLIDRFDTKNQGKSERLSEDGLLENLKKFKILLELTGQMDRSENSRFFQRLSESWVRLLQDIQVLSLTKRKQVIDLKKLSILITDIDHFPSNEEHKLGYYLSNYAGEDWLPFPFREILKQLYSDHEINKKNSVLSKWIQLIEELLQS